MASISSESIDSYFEKVFSNLPFLVMCENQNSYDIHMNTVNNMLNETKANLINKELSQDDFINEVKASVKLIRKYVEDKINEPHNLYELQYLQTKLTKILIDPYNFSIKKAEEKTSNINISPFNKLKQVYSQITDSFIFHKNLNETDIKEELWEIIAKEKINTIIKDFGLKSISVSSKKSWKEIYDWAKTTYLSISEAQEAIGFEKIHVGLNNTLNICFDDIYLDEINAGGLMYTGEFSNIILLGNYPIEIQKSIWQHEYAHALDNRAGIAFLKQSNEYVSGQGLENSFLTLQQVNNVFSDGINKINIPNKLALNAEIWTSETMSLILGGNSSQEFINLQNQAKKKFTEEINKYLLISILPEQEKKWLTLTPETQQKLLNMTELTNSSYGILNLLIKNPKPNFEHKFLNTSLKDESITCHLNSLCLNICAELNIDKPREFLVNMTNSLKKNQTQLYKDYSVYIRHNSYISDGLTSYFSDSYSSNSVDSEVIFKNNNYWNKPIEIFARACENLQSPFSMVCNKHHLTGSKEEKITSSDYIEPSLNRSDRILFLNCLHSMGRLIGMDIQCDLQSLKPLQKVIPEKDVDFSLHNITDSKDEKISKSILMIAKIRSDLVNNRQSNNLKIK